MSEIWADIARAPDYQVSTWGAVRSKDRVVITKNGQSRRYSGKTLSPSTSHGGYPQYNLRCDGRIITARAHVLAAEAFIGPRGPGEQVCHIDGDPSNPRVENLRYDSPKGNSRDKKRHGTTRIGADHPGAKLNDAKVLHIKYCLKKGYKQTDIAEHFAVSRATISAISTGRAWGHLFDQHASGPTVFVGRQQ